MNISPAPIGFSLMFANEDRTDYFLVKPVGILAYDNGDVCLEPLTTDPELGIIFAKHAENYVGLAPDKEADGFFKDWKTSKTPEVAGPEHGGTE